MSNFPTQPPTDVARNIALACVVGVAVAFRLAIACFTANTPKIPNQYPGESPSKFYTTYRVNVACNHYHGPTQAAAIKPGMTYPQVRIAVQTGITRPAEKRVQREEDAEIWYNNPDKSTLEVQLRSGHVVFAKFMTQEEANDAKANPTPRPADSDAE